jgi:glycosyltransferase involved in cell wall biosynthesis
MQEKPLVSIITPVYNCESYIANTIESVLNSTINVSYEYIVVDDGSTDATTSIVMQFKNQIQYFSKSNGGESSAVNLGIEKAQGRYILVLNADDPLLTGQLINKLVPVMESTVSLVAIYPDWQVIDSEGNLLEEIRLPDFTEEIFIGLNRCLPGPGTMFRRDAAIRIGCRSEEWKYVGDYDFWLRLSRLGEIRHFPEVLSQWRSSSVSTSVSMRGSEMARERIKVIADFLASMPTDFHLRRKALGRAHYLAARLVFFDKKVSGRNLLIKGFRIRGGWIEKSNLLVLLYIFLTPVSEWIVKSLRIPNQVIRVR